jgi:hypothetical protein
MRGVGGRTNWDSNGPIRLNDERPGTPEDGGGSGQHLQRGDEGTSLEAESPLPHVAIRRARDSTGGGRGGGGGLVDWDVVSKQPKVKKATAGAGGGGLGRLLSKGAKGIAKAAARAVSPRVSRPLTGGGGGVRESQSQGTITIHQIRDSYGGGGGGRGGGGGGRGGGGGGGQGPTQEYLSDLSEHYQDAVNGLEKDREVLRLELQRLLAAERWGWHFSRYVILQSKHGSVDDSQPVYMVHVRST